MTNPWSLIYTVALFPSSFWFLLYQMITSSPSLVSNHHNKTCLNFSLTYLFFGTIKHILYHFCLDMLMWYQTAVTYWDRVTQSTMISDMVFKNYRRCKDDAIRVGQWSPYPCILPFWQCLSILACVLLLSCGGFSQDISRSTYSTLSTWQSVWLHFLS